MRSKDIIVAVIGICVLSLVVSCGGDAPKKKRSKTIEHTAKKISKTSNEVVRKSENSSNASQDDQGTPPEQIEKAKELIAAATDEKLATMRPNKLFKNYCAICHGFKGNMQINGAKDLTKSTLSLEESVAQVYHGKGLMTPFKGIMKDDEIVAVSKYLEELRK